MASLKQIEENDEKIERRKLWIDFVVTQHRYIHRVNGAFDLVFTTSFFERKRLFVEHNSIMCYIFFFSEGAGLNIKDNRKARSKSLFCTHLNISVSCINLLSMHMSNML